ncbi:hypothetical protein [Helicobacter rodentium]|uniref:hypothetical protein n=3 Tax=Helicobacter rodentium TaxID=59617 RepID=UPI002578E850|nr:hypothetical protein [Helicobacter rodentium]
MKRILFILSCIFCININANNTSNNVKFGNAVRNLKHYGFSFCLEQSYVDKKEKVYPPTRRLDLLSYDLRVSQQGSMKFAWIGGFKIQEQVATDIRSYVSQFMSSPQRKATTKQGHRVLVQDCMQLYDSKEYQDEVERIVKKYCKECK